MVRSQSRSMRIIGTCAYTGRKPANHVDHAQDNFPNRYADIAFMLLLKTVEIK